MTASNDPFAIDERSGRNGVFTLPPMAASDDDLLPAPFLDGDEQDTVSADAPADQQAATCPADAAAAADPSQDDEHPFVLPDTTNRGPAIPEPVFLRQDPEATTGLSLPPAPAALRFLLDEDGIQAVQEEDPLMAGLEQAPLLILDQVSHRSEPRWRRAIRPATGDEPTAGDTPAGRHRNQTPVGMDAARMGTSRSLPSTDQTVFGMDQTLVGGRPPAPSDSADRTVFGMDQTLSGSTTPTSRPDGDRTVFGMDQTLPGSKSPADATVHGMDVTVVGQTGRDVSDHGTEATLHIRPDPDLGTEPTLSVAQQQRLGGRQVFSDHTVLGTDRTLAAAGPDLDETDGTVLGADPTVPIRRQQESQDATDPTVHPDRPATRPTQFAGSPVNPSTPTTGFGSGSKGRRKSRLDQSADWHMQGKPGPATGQQWGDYEIGTVLGRGGMGLVYKAYQTTLGRRCAVKVLAEHLAQNEQVRERFELEARATSVLQSANIVAVYAAGNIDGQPYFVMEFVDGGDLSERLKGLRDADRHADIDQVVQWVLQAARGLSEAWQHTIVHRDIKPGNLMLTRDGVVKITDFGIVKVKGESTMTLTGQAIGTPAYLSPEQGRGEDVDHRSDLYSLGVVMYELLTRQKPFTGSSADALIYMHSYEEPTLPKELNPDIPDAVQAICIKLLAKKPDNRYQSARDLIRDLEDFSEGKRLEVLLAQGRLSTGGAEALAENKTWMERNLLWLSGGIAAAAVLLITGVVWYSSHQEELARQAALHKDQLGRLRSELALLDSPRPLPSATADKLAEFSHLISTYEQVALPSDHAAKQRWTDKIERVQQLRAQLSGLEDSDAEQWQATDIRKWRQALTELEDAVGGQAPGIKDWNQALQQIDAHIAELTTRLQDTTALTNTEIPTGLRNRAGIELNQLQRLLGPEHETVVAAAQRLQAYDQALAELRDH
ncbi:MAG: protein kinase domain-containing protein, partial [Planctomycetota bacterium]